MLTQSHTAASDEHARFVEAVTTLSAVVGYAPMTVEDIVTTAALPPASFYALFTSKEDAFLQALDDVGGQLFADVAQAVAAAEGFPGRVEAGVRRLLERFAALPSHADLCLVQALDADPQAAEHRSLALRRFTELMLIVVEEELPERDRPPEIVAQAIVGGIGEILYARAVRGELGDLPRLLPDLMYSILLPYVGVAAAVEHQRRLRIP